MRFSQKSELLLPSGGRLKIKQGEVISLGINLLLSITSLYSNIECF